MLNLAKQDSLFYARTKPSDYEMYYCYWNRHNDNNDPNLMGPMEFAVVRNNVYKLMVNKINNIAILPRQVLKMIPIRSIRGNPG